jgi:ABA4-like protein
MTAEQVFSLASMVATLGWLVLAVAGRRTWASGLVSGIVIPLALAVLYAGLLAANWGGSKGGFGSLADVALLFSSEWVLLAGWVHYLAFDLFIGSWETRDAVRHGVPHLLVIPCLVLTFLFGPVGLLLYFGLRTWKAGGVTVA